MTHQPAQQPGLLKGLRLTHGGTAAGQSTSELYRGWHRGCCPGKQGREQSCVSLTRGHMGCHFAQLGSHGSFRCWMRPTRQLGQPLLHQMSLLESPRLLRCSSLNGPTNGYSVTLFRMVLSIWSSALRAVRWMSCESLPMAMLKTVRTCTRDSSAAKMRSLGSPWNIHGHAVAREDGGRSVQEGPVSCGPPMAVGIHTAAD